MIDALLPDLATGVRAATVTVLPIALSVRHAWPELWWMMLGGWFGTLADPRGDRAERARVVCAFAALGSAIVALGEICATTLALAMIVMAGVAFGGAMLRALGGAASSVGTLLTIVAAVAITRHPAEPIHDVIGFAVGCGLAVLLSSMLWPIGMYAPERRAAGDAFVTAASLVRHAICVAVAASASVAIGSWLSPRFASWVTLTAVVVLQPDASSTKRRVGERLVGTVLGGLAAIVVARLVLHPLAVAAILFPLAVAALVTRSRSYRWFTFFLTPMFVLVAMQEPGEWWIAFARAGDALLGGLIALGASVACGYADHVMSSPPPRSAATPGAAVMRRTLDRLAANPDVEAFLGHVATVATETLGADSAGVWRADADGRSRLVLMLEDGQVRTPRAGDPVLAFAEQPTDVAFLPRPRGEMMVRDVMSPEYDGAEALRAYLVARGIRTVLTAPMYFGDEFRGALALRFTSERRLNAEETELAHAFANQAVLAMELGRLTTASRAAAVVEERNRLAREIHDTIAQGLAAIVRQLESAAAEGEPAAAMRHVSVATELARESLVEARRSIRALRPSLLEGAALDLALRDLVERAARISLAPVRLRVSGDRRDVPSEVEGELFRVASEAITNAIKHARADAIDVELAFDDESVRVVVRDDGAGFDAERPFGGTVGLSSMRERALRIGAAMTIASEPGCGTEILVYWPLCAEKGRGS